MNFQTLVSLLLISSLFSCTSNSTDKTEQQTEPVNEQLFLNLGGEEQYVEIMGKSAENPVMLFVHGGPAWPQTPQIRYLNAEIADAYTLVLWEQRGAGKSYGKNPEPANLTLEQIVSDGNELVEWLKEKFQQDKIYLAGYSWGSLVGVKMVQQHPENYLAYLGISQFINKDDGMKISQDWLLEQATARNDKSALQKLDSLKNPAFYTDEQDRFFQQYLLVDSFGGAVYNKETLPEIAKAETMYDDYKGYDWYAVYKASAKVLQKELYHVDVRDIHQLEVPVFLFQGRHDWNVPSVLAQAWLDNLQAPQKEIIWFENSGHGPLEEEPETFNKAIIEVKDEMQSHS